MAEPSTAQEHRLRSLLATDGVIGAWAGPYSPGTAYVLFHHVMGETEGKQSDFTLRRPLSLCVAPGGWFVTDAEQCGVFYVKEGKAFLLAGRSHGHTPFPGWEDNDGHRALFGQVSAIASDGKGHLYVSDTSSNCIRRITLPEDLGGRRETLP